MAIHDFSNRTLDGRYTLVRRIGYGGMATVYEAVDHQLDKRVAVKVLNPEYTADDDHMARFRQEARSAAKVRHPHLVDVTDQGYTQDGLAYFVMEYMEGESLGEHVHRVAGPLPWLLVVEIVTQVCSALELAHERGIIHRDIKPANCFIENRKGTGQLIFIKVLDLGIAKVRRDERDGRALPSTRDSQGVPGTPEYMAPELARGLAYDRRVDIYALGVMMYRLLTGELPFYSDASPFVTLEMHCNRLPRPPRELNPQIPERIEKIVLTALKKLPEERYSTAGELATALERAREHEGMQFTLEDGRTQQYVRGPAAPTMGRRLVHVSTALGGLTTAAAMFMILMLFEGPGQTAAPTTRGTPSSTQPKVIIQEPTTPARLPEADPGVPVSAPPPAVAVKGTPVPVEKPVVQAADEPEVDAGVGSTVEAGGVGAPGDAGVGKAGSTDEPAASKPAKGAPGAPDGAGPPKAPKRESGAANKGDTKKAGGGESSSSSQRDPDGKMVEAAILKGTGAVNAACKGLMSMFEDKVTVSAALALNASGGITRVSADPPHSGTNLGRCVEKQLALVKLRKLEGSRLSFTVKVVIRRK